MQKYIKSADTGYLPSDFGINDSNDCAIRAIANVSDIPYPELNAKVNSLGRKKGKGTPFQALNKVYIDSGAKFSVLWGKQGRKLQRLITYNDIADKGITIGKFVEAFPKGRHILLIRRHALAVVNGKVIDSFDNKANARVMASYHF